MPKERFAILDGMRGVAAITVMLYHFFPDAPYTLLSHSYLAVDLFFLLSGFVIAYTYERKLEGGLSLGAFAVARGIRLYPLIVAGVLSVAALNIVYPGPDRPNAEFVYNLVMNALLLPNSVTSSAERFTFVPPAWSLFYELVVNLLYAACLPLLGRRTLLLLLGAAGVALAVLTWQNGSVRLLHQSIPAGVARTSFSFLMGVLIYRNLLIGRSVSIRLPMPLQYGALLALLLCPSVGTWDWLYDLAAIAVAFPLMIAAAVRRPSHERRPIENELGEMSYPIYVLHMPVFAYTSVALGWTGHLRVIAAAASILTLFAASLAWRLYDRPVRNWLNVRLGSARPQAALRAEP